MIKNALPDTYISNLLKISFGKDFNDSSGKMLSQIFQSWSEQPETSNPTESSKWKWLNFLHYSHSQAF